MGYDSGRGIVVAPLFRGIQPHFFPTAAKRALLVVALALMGAAGYVLAAPSTGEAVLLACVPGNLDMYIALGSTGCTIDDKTFSNFAWENSVAHGDAVPVPSTSVLVNPVLTPGNPGLTFTGPFAATGISTPPNDIEQFVTGGILFVVNTISRAALIEDASLSVVQGGTGSFANHVEEFLCLGVSYSSCTISTPHVDLLVQNVSGSDSATFTPQSLVSPHLGLIASATSSGSSAFVTSATLQFSEVPEPATMALFGTGLLGLASRRLLRRRR